MKFEMDKIAVNVMQPKQKRTKASKLRKTHPQKGSVSFEPILHGSVRNTIAEPCSPCIVRVESLANRAGGTSMSHREGEFYFQRKSNLVFAFLDDLASLGPFNLHLLVRCNKE
jgi:hypothetical protein